MRYRQLFGQLRLPAAIWLTFIVLGGPVHHLWHDHGPEEDKSVRFLDCDDSCSDPRHHHHDHGGTNTVECMWCAAHHADPVDLVTTVGPAVSPAPSATPSGDRSVFFSVFDDALPTRGPPARTV